MSSVFFSNKKSLPVFLFCILNLQLFAADYGSDEIKIKTIDEAIEEQNFSKFNSSIGRLTPDEICSHYKEGDTLLHRVIDKLTIKHQETNGSILTHYENLTNSHKIFISLLKYPEFLTRHLSDENNIPLKKLIPDCNDDESSHKLKKELIIEYMKAVLNNNNKSTKSNKIYAMVLRKILGEEILNSIAPDLIKHNKDSIILLNLYHPEIFNKTLLDLSKSDNNDIYLTKIIKTSLVDLNLKKPAEFEFNKNEPSTIYEAINMKDSQAFKNFMRQLSPEQICSYDNQGFTLLHLAISKLVRAIELGYQESSEQMKNLHEIFISLLKYPDLLIKENYFNLPRWSDKPYIPLENLNIKTRDNISFFTAKKKLIIEYIKAILDNEEQILETNNYFPDVLKETLKPFMIKNISSDLIHYKANSNILKHICPENIYNTVLFDIINDAIANKNFSKFESLMAKIGEDTINSTDKDGNTLLHIATYMLINNLDNSDCEKIFYNLLKHPILLTKQRNNNLKYRSHIPLNMLIGFTKNELSYSLFEKKKNMIIKYVIAALDHEDEILKLDQNFAHVLNEILEPVKELISDSIKDHKDSSVILDTLYKDTSNKTGIYSFAHDVWA